MSYIHKEKKLEKLFPNENKAKNGSFSLFYFLPYSMCKKKDWNREYFRIPVFNVFTRFGIFSTVGFTSRY